MDTPPSLPLFHEEWILDKTQKKDWEDFLASQGLTLGMIQDILSGYRLASLSFGDPAPSAQLRQEEAPESSPFSLWENQTVEIYAPPRPRVRHHLWVALKRPALFSQVTEYEFVQLKSTVHKILRILEESFALRAVVAQWNEPQPGQPLKQFTIEIIPGRLDSRKFANFWDKVESNNYVLFRTLFPSSIPEPSDEEKSSDREFWKEALRTREAPLFSTMISNEPLDSWALKQSNLSSGAAKIFNCIEQLSLQQGLRLERSPTSQKILDLQFSTTNQGCPFCSDAVIDSQTVYETELSRIFYNFKPAIVGAHFLIVPKRHLRTTDLLREDEIRDIYRLAQKLTKVLEEKTGRSDIKMYTQDGPAVGQTVAHTHMHLMLTPQPLRYLFFSLNYQKEKTLSIEEMQTVAKEIEQRLENLN